jgi:heat shock protein HslJ
VDRRLVRVSLLVGLVLLAVGCGSSSPTAAPTAPTSLAGTSWTLGAQGGSAPAADVQPTLVFGTDGSVTGNTTCNNFKGTYTSTASAITFSGLALTTQQTCPADGLAIQQTYLAGLTGATGWTTQNVDAVVPSGVKVLAPVKLALTGSATLIFTQN